jgi:hypothetical protein
MTRTIVFSILFLCLTMASLHGFDTGRKPLKAAAMSLVIPGGGQYYNDQYLKMAVFGGTEVVLIGKLLYDNHQQNKYYDKALNTSGLDYQHNENMYYKYYNRKQSDWWWVGTVVFLSMIDSYVDANLYNYEQTKKNLHIRFEGDKAMVSYDF